MVEKLATLRSVAGRCLLRKARAMSIDECPVARIDSFLRDQRAVMSVEGKDAEPTDIATGFPQGSPILPVLIAICIANIRDAVER